MNLTDFSSPVFAQWRENATSDWSAYTHHAFVRGLADDSLPQKAFLHYLVQDYIFLFHFSRAWGMAVLKAESHEELELASATVNALVNHEMPLHVEICAQAGISRQALLDTEEEPENLSYTRYVIDAGLSGDFLDLLAALTPCVLGYGEIGTRLAAVATKNNRYQPWIDTYAGKDYQDTCHAVGRLIESSTRARLGSSPQASARWKTLNRHFRVATRLEVGFWSMGMRGGN
ncbi:TenA family protein [Phyllobacterium sp. 628]|uniref:TenA family protein n=1 Tax=Phyllobacterium sp. 628 TaxID=2718938 RepID=UPI0016625D84|nr:TenA family protein [Phyllobacterium sp. 628]QND53595.1 TenA family protein [Phyllobacterium sp. 628]